MALRFVSFRHIKTIWFGLKNGRDESAPTPCGMFAAIHLRTINRPLRLRNGRGKIYQQTTTYGLFIIQNVWQRTHRNIHFLRKYIATCTPQGVGADSSRPFYNPNQMILM